MIEKSKEKNSHLKRSDSPDLSPPHYNESPNIGSIQEFSLTPQKIDDYRFGTDGHNETSNQSLNTFEFPPVNMSRKHKNSNFSSKISQALNLASKRASISRRKTERLFKVGTEFKVIG